jgi:hypothetical protein
MAVERNEDKCMMKKGLVLAVAAEVLIVVGFVALSQLVGYVAAEGTVGFLYGHLELQYFAILAESVLPSFLIGRYVQKSHVVVAVVFRAITLFVWFALFWAGPGDGFATHPISMMLAYLLVAGLIARVSKPGRPAAI